MQSKVRRRMRTFHFWVALLLFNDRTTNRRQADQAPVKTAEMSLMSARGAESQEARSPDRAPFVALGWRRRHSTSLALLAPCPAGILRVSYQGLRPVQM